MGMTILTETFKLCAKESSSIKIKDTCYRFKIDLLEEEFLEVQFQGFHLICHSPKVGNLNKKIILY